MKHYILKEGDLLIAILYQREDKHEFYVAVRQAIADDNAVPVNNISLAVDDHLSEITFEFESTIIDDGEEFLRTYILEELPAY